MIPIVGHLRPLAPGNEALKRPLWGDTSAIVWFKIPTLDPEWILMVRMVRKILGQISSGAIRCSFNTRFRTRFRRVLVQIPREVPEGSSADTS